MDKPQKWLDQATPDRQSYCLIALLEVIEGRGYFDGVEGLTDVQRFALNACAEAFDLFDAEDGDEFTYEDMDRWIDERRCEHGIYERRHCEDCMQRNMKDTIANGAQGEAT